MAKGKCRSIINRNQGIMLASEPNYPTIESPGYPNTPEKQEMDLKALVRMLLEEHMKDINKSLKKFRRKMIKN